MSGEGPRQILLIKVSSIGDVVHTIPSSALLARRYPAAGIDWLVGRKAAPVVRELPWVRRTLILEETGPIALRRAGYDIAIDFQGLLRSSLATLLSGSRLRAGRGRWPWLHRSVPMFDGAATPHAVENTARTLGALGIPTADAGAAARDFLEGLGERLRARGRELAAGLDLSGPFRAWFPFSRWPSKDLPLDRLGPRDARHVLLGGPRQGLRVARPGILDLAGRLPLLDSVGLALVAERVVAADTGPAHLAALLGARITGIYGPTRARHTGLRGPRAENVESGCGGCLARLCPRSRRCVGEALERVL